MPAYWPSMCRCSEVGKKGAQKREMGWRLEWAPSAFREWWKLRLLGKKITRQLQRVPYTEGRAMVVSEGEEAVRVNMYLVPKPNLN